MGRRKSYNWLEIFERWASRERIEDLAEEYGFNVKYWYRNYHREWETKLESIKRETERVIYERAINEEVEKREEKRKTFISLYDELTLRTVTVLRDDKIDLKTKQLKLNIITSALNNISKIRAEQSELLFIYTKEDRRGDLVPEDMGDEPELKGV